MKLSGVQLSALAGKAASANVQAKSVGMNKVQVTMTVNKGKLNTKA